LRAELEAAMARVHDRGWYILGPEVEAFEREFAAYLGVAECIAVGNGTDALELALRALTVGSGDTVATVANAGMYATTAIRAVGAVPAYVEIDPRRSRWIPRRSPRLRRAAAGDRRHAPVRPAGRHRRARPHRARAAHPVDRGLRAGARREARRSLRRHARAARLLQLLSDEESGRAGRRGAVVTDDRELAAKLRALRVYGWGAKYHCTMQGGMNSRMDELQAAVLRAKLPHLDRWNLRRREIAARYTKAIRHPYIVLPPSSTTAATSRISTSCARGRASPCAST
jgi:dTDP-4-amino-4,6-dideoxygalactose transaminase